MADSTLCCCEYVDENGDRKHILECCCNCVELDYCFERCITCKPIPYSLLTKIMAMISERCRVPWKGGARQCSFSVILPIVMIPLFLIAAAQGVWMSVVTFAFLPIFLIYFHFIFMKFYSYTPFFFVWNIGTFFTIFIIFEYIGVTLLEIRGDENIAVIILVLFVFYCIYKVKEKEKLSFVFSDYSGDMKASLLCPDCNFKVPPRTFHCYSCQACVMMRDQHCAWFNCCIGEKNHKWYMVFLIASLSFLLLCSNLILTTACHPAKFIGSIMLPDDCTEVYFDILYAICFVTSIYCIEAAVFILSVILFEFWLITIGMTGHEFRNRSRRAILCGLCSSRPYSKGIIRNWVTYFKGTNNVYIHYNI